MNCEICHQANSPEARFCSSCGAALAAALGTPVHDSTDPLIGAMVGGRYRVMSVLGEGGMGRVYTAEQSMGTTVRKVAIKTLLSQYAADPQTVARFMRECGTVAELEHPNTIKVYDFGQTDSGELYIAMELLGGTSVDGALAHGPLSPERVRHIIGQVAGSLEEAHGKGIIHRDLKPANIFLTSRAGDTDYVKVLDFGIAKKHSPNSDEQKLTRQGTILGTPPYMSPEQFAAAELDPRSDIYSLAIVAYEMLTGRLPFEAKTPWEWATQHMSAQPFPFETVATGANIPPNMKAAIFRALSKRREDRQATVSEFHRELSLPAQSRSGEGSGAGSDAFAATAAIPSVPFQGAPPKTAIAEPVFAAAPAQRTVIEDDLQAAQPPSPPAAARRSPALLVGGVITAVAALGLGAWALSGSKKSAGDAPTIDLPPQPSGQVAVVEDPAPPAAPAPSAATDAAATMRPSQVDTKPMATAADGPGSAACEAARNLAFGNNVALAIKKMSECKGPGRAGAVAAIDAAALRQAKATGCKARATANAAASIGATSARNELKRKCK